MNNVQFENLMIFAFLFVQSDLDKYDPEYICEKWDSFLSVDDNDIKIYTGTISPLGSYESIWGKIKDDIVFTKVLLVHDLKTLQDGKSFSLSNVIEVFERFIDLSKVTENESMHFHPILHEAIEEWMGYPINLKTYKSYMRDFGIDSILTD